jgi:hypothetical protein
MLKCDKSEKVKFEIPKNIHSFTTFEFFQGMGKKEKEKLWKKANRENYSKEILRLRKH